MKKFIKGLVTVNVVLAMAFGVVFADSGSVTAQETYLPSGVMTIAKLVRLQ